MMEVLMVLPFIIFIMILSANFAKAFLMKQRSLLAVRYVALSDVHRRPIPTDEWISKQFFRNEPAQIVTTRSNVQGQDVNDQASKAAGEKLEVPKDGVSGWLNSFSGTNAYEVKHQYRPLFAAGNYWGSGKSKWFPAVNVTSKLVMDSKDWRYDEISFWTLLRDAASGIFGGLRSVLG